MNPTRGVAIRCVARVVEPGQVELRVGASGADIRQVLEFVLVGPRRSVGSDRHLEPEVVVAPVADR